MKNPYNNANMWQKSMIRQILERNSVLESFKYKLGQLIENYTVKDNVFGVIQGTPSEINEGYFVIEQECSDLPSAIKEMNGDLEKCIRIVENSKFQVGTWNKRFSECDSNHSVLDIENQLLIER